MFDSTKSGRIEKEKVRTILNTLGHTFDDHELEVLLKQEDEEGIHRTLLSPSPFFFSFSMKKRFRSSFTAIIIIIFFFFGTTCSTLDVDRSASFERTRPNNNS